jgi:hypothetical protein
MELHFFFKVYSGIVEFVTWYLLSAYIKEGPVNGILIMQSFSEVLAAFLFRAS